MPYTVLGMRARWLPRRPTSRAGVQRARVTALILFAATTALAVLLAILSHLAWPPVLVGILATAPALYVAWLAVPGVISPPEPAKKLAHGRPVAQWNPVDLGVHQVIGGGPMPIYIRRPHDELLRAVMDPAVPTSRLVVVRGGSSTGKTRAAYEAVADRLADWQLDYPLNVAALAARLDAGIPARTVLWLGELRQYADADGGPAVLGRLADLLQGEDHLVITTVWPEQWNTYTAAARAGPGTADPAGTAGRLLERLPELTASDPAGIDPARGGVIEVPARFTTAEMTTAATAGDSVLAEAAAAAASAGKDGQVTQFLAGVPDLLRRYVGPGGDPYGQAVITAAMDAARLGHASPLPAALVQEAAVGYLTGPQRTEDIASWRDTALAWATEELKGAVRALQPVPPPSGTGVAGYQVADYLDQHGRRNRQDQLGPPSLWDALTARTASASDLARLGQAARDRGLYRHAAALWTTAATLGSTNAARQLITHLRQVSPVDTTRAAQWAVSHASLDDPWAVAELLGTLDAAGVSDAAAALASRAAGHASVDDPQAVAWLLRALDAAGASDAVTALASRAAGHASVDDPQAVAELLRALDEAGASGAAAALLARDPAGHASVDDPQAVAELLRALDAAGASDAVTALASRAAGHASVDDPRAVAELLRALDAAGASGAAAALASRAAGHASLDDPWAVAELLGALDAAGASGAAAALASRAAGHASLDDPWAVAELLGALDAAGASGAAAALASRAAGHASLDDPWAVAELLGALDAAGASGAAAALASRAAGHASLDDPWAVAELLRALDAAGASGAAAALLARDPAGHASLDDPQAVAELLRALDAAGASGAAAALLARDPAGHASLDDPQAVAWLLEALDAAGASGAAAALLARDPAGHASLDDPQAVAWLLEALREAGASGVVTALASRAANAGMFDLFLEVHPDEAPSYLFGREPDGTPSQSWEWQEPTSQNRGLQM